MPSACRPSLPLSAILALLALLAGPSAAQWSSDASANTAIVVKPSEQVLPKLDSAPDGSTWVGWFDLAAGSYDVYVQRLDVEGVARFAATGLLVSDHPQNSSLVDWDLISDRQGNAILVFTDIRDGGDLDVFAYKITPDGQFAWGRDGVQLSLNDDFEPAPRVVEASDGDLVFVWARLPSGGDGGLMMQRLSPAGTPRFPAGGLTVVTQPGEDPAFCDVTAAEGGRVIICWVRDITTFFSLRHVRARKFAADGSPLWPSHVDVYDASSVPIAHQPGLAPDGQGGALLWWHRSDLGGSFNSFVQHLDATGAELFPHNGAAVASTPSNHLDPTLSYDAVSGNAFVFWNERNSTQSQWGLYGQRLDAAGAPQWGAGGLPLLAVDGVFKGPPRSLPWAGGAMVFVYDEPTGQFGKNRALGFRVDAAGNSLWGAGPKVLSSVLSSKSRLPVTLDCLGTAKVVWEDDRNGTPDLYAQAVRADGTLGGSPDPWTDLGGALGGTAGLPQLQGSSLLCGGDTVTLTLDDALPDSTTTLVIGLAALNAPFKGGTLVPDPLLYVFGLPTGPAGQLVLSAPWPVGLPGGLVSYYQHWIVDAAGPAGFSASNGLSGVTP
jgi:hypothetical protein